VVEERPKRGDERKPKSIKKGVIIKPIVKEKVGKDVKKYKKFTIMFSAFETKIFNIFNF
jgi:hypothetical protein